MSETAPLLSIEGLKRHYTSQRRTRDGQGTVYAVDQVSLFIRQGETLGLVGESGCGKSTTGRMIVGLDRPTAGTIHFNGEDLTGLSDAGWRAKRREIQMIFQNPIGALNPRIRIGRQIREPLDLHNIGHRADRDAVVAGLVRDVSLSPRLLDRYPHQISGGQAQRAVIARALALQPKLVVCDEPVSALDVSVGARVAALLFELQRQRDITYLFISHDLRVVKKLSHRVAVMYLGEVVETGPTDQVYNQPAHPYTMALISAIPSAHSGGARNKRRLSGDPPSPTTLPAGCRFCGRCPFARERCRVEHPELRTLGGTHSVRCHFAEEIAAGAQAGNETPAPAWGEAQ